jgi:lipoprotein-anchoring transpeptidase ErfK/SrfK
MSAGSVRQRPHEARWLYGWAEIGTLVVVLA